MSFSKFQAGYSEIDWTPPPGLALRGQMQLRIATHARDPLTTCAAAFAQGRTIAVFVVVNISLLYPEVVVLAGQHQRRH